MAWDLGLKTVFSGYSPDGWIEYSRRSILPEKKQGEFGVLALNRVIERFERILLDGGIE